MHTTYHSACLMSSAFAFRRPILSNTHTCNDLGMSTKEDRLRSRAARYIGRHRRSGLKSLAAKSGYSRQWISIFIDGKRNQQADFSDAIQGALDHLEATEWGVPIERLDHPFFEIAEELDDLAQALRAPSPDDDAVVERFLKRIAELHAMADSLRGEVNKRSKRSRKA